MSSARKVVIETVDPMGRRVVCFESTLSAHRLKHEEPFTDDDVVQCVHEPDMIAMTGHEELAHKERRTYYKDKQFDDAPKTMKAIVEHGRQPGVLVSMFRTSSRTMDGTIEYIREGYLEERLHEGDTR